MNWGNKLALTLAAEDALVAIVYAFQKDWPRFAYWIFAAGITGSTVFIR